MNERKGPRTQLDELVSALYTTLRRSAARALGHGAGRRSISPTDLVNECYLKLIRAQALNGLRRTEFVALACRAMRNVLIDRARQRNSQKRGGHHEQITLDGASLQQPEEVDLLELDIALQKLALLDERQSRVVELRFFGGLTHEEIAEVLGCSSRTVNGEWALAKAWLHKELTRD